MFKGFKDFLMRGNVIDLAVAVVIGTAFTAVVTSVTKGIINPLLAVFGTTNELGLGVQLVGSKPATFVEIGPIITSIINFVMVAAVLYFILMVPMMTLKNRFGTTKAAEPSETELLIEIRDLLAKRNLDSVAEAIAMEKANVAPSAQAVSTYRGGPGATGVAEIAAGDSSNAESDCH